MNLEEYVGRLLYRYDCIIVPGFGGLVASYESATIHPVTHIMNPPSKSLSFNALLTQNDGLLANEIASGENVSYDEALEMIELEVQKMKGQMMKNAQVDWAKIGTFLHNAEGKIIFKPHHAVNYLTDSFGLSLMRSPAIQRQESKKKLAPQIPEELVLPAAVAQRTVPGWLKSAAILIPLIGIATLSWWQRDAVKQGVYTSVLHFTATGPVAYEPRTDENTEAAPENTLELDDWWSIAHSPMEADLEIESEDVANEPKEEILVEKNETAIDAVSNSGQFHIVAGCFSEERNAEKLQKRLSASGLPSRRIGKTTKGLHIVTYASFSSRREALEALPKIKAEQSKEAWLLKK